MLHKQCKRQTQKFSAENQNSRRPLTHILFSHKSAALSTNREKSTQTRNIFSFPSLFTVYQQRKIHGLLPLPHGCDFLAPLPHLITRQTLSRLITPPCNYALRSLTRNNNNNNRAALAKKCVNAELALHTRGSLTPPRICTLGKSSSSRARPAVARGPGNNHKDMTLHIYIYIAIYTSCGGKTMRRDERRASTIRASAGKQNPVGKKTRACREQLAGFASRVRRDCDRVYNDWGGKKGRREREREQIAT